MANNEGLTSTDKLTYSNYLRLPQILTQQFPRCAPEAPDELAFIVLHQVFELLFLLVVRTTEAVRRLLRADFHKTDISLVCHYLDRMVRIWQHTNAQFDVMETITATGFVEFRKVLDGASGAQSLQFREIENILGVEICGSRACYSTHKGDDEVRLRRSEQEPSLFRILDDWLSRIPDETMVPFLKGYEKAVDLYCRETNADVESFNTVMDAEGYQRCVAKASEDEQKTTKARNHFSHRAFKNALMIVVYSDKQCFHLPYQMLSQLMDIDSQLKMWRVNHKALVQRAIGGMRGTGGSVGYGYLHKTVSNDCQAFRDLFNLAAFLVPRKYLVEGLSLSHSDQQEASSSLSTAIVSKEQTTSLSESWRAQLSYHKLTARIPKLL